MTIFSPHASQKVPRTGKSPVRGKIRAPCIQNELALAGYARHASEKPCKQPFGDTPCEDLAMKGPFSLHGPSESCTARRSCRPSQRQTARAPATPGAAEQREPPELDCPTQETQPGRQRPRRLLGGKYRQQLPRHRHRSLPTPASSLSPPANNSVIADSASCGDSIHAATAPPIRQAALAQKGATFPACGACLLCSWQMRSAYKRQAEPLLRDYFVTVA